MKSKKQPTPKEIRGALKYFNKYHDELFKIQMRSRKDKKLFSKLVAWSKSLTGNNCWFGEYDAKEWIDLEMLVRDHATGQRGEALPK